VEQPTGLTVPIHSQDRVHLPIIGVLGLNQNVCQLVVARTPSGSLQFWTELVWGSSLAGVSVGGQFRRFASPSPERLDVDLLHGKLVQSASAVGVPMFLCS